MQQAAMPLSRRRRQVGRYDALSITPINQTGKPRLPNLILKYERNRLRPPRTWWGHSDYPKQTRITVLTTPQTPPAPNSKGSKNVGAGSFFSYPTDPLRPVFSSVLGARKRKIEDHDYD